MKIKITFILLAVFFCFSVPLAKEWYEGGTLHNATVSKYLMGNYDDILATTGDWVASTISDREIQKISMEDIKKGTFGVYQCVKKAGKGNKAVANNKAAELAFLCMAQLKKYFPWMLTKY